MARICDDPNKERAREERSKKRARIESASTAAETAIARATAAVAPSAADAVVGRSKQLNPKSGAGYLGVHGQPGKFRCRIYYEGKQHYLGVFKTKEQAAAAYDVAARQHRGANAETNFSSPAVAAAAASHALANYAKAPAPKTKPLPKSTFHGVHATNSSKKCPWRARIYHDGKQHYIGSFKTEEEAAKAYDVEARRQRGSDVVCNFPPDKAPASAKVGRPTDGKV